MKFEFTGGAELDFSIEGLDRELTFKGGELVNLTKEGEETKIPFRKLSLSYDPIARKIILEVQDPRISKLDYDEIISNKKGVFEFYKDEELVVVVNMNEKTIRPPLGVEPTPYTEVRFKRFPDGAQQVKFSEPQTIKIES